MDNIPTPRPLVSYIENTIDPETNQPATNVLVNGFLTGPQIAKTYQTPASTAYGVKIGIFSFGGGFLQSDFNSTFANLQSAGYIASNLTAPTIRQVLLNGQHGTFSTNDSNASLENTLDISLIGTLCPQANITLYIGSNYTSMMNQAIADGCNIISISWAANEYTSDESNFINAVANGLTVCASSGDYGSIGNTGNTNDTVVYPSVSPNVISVGGTYLTVYSNAGSLNDTRLTELDSNRSGLGGGGGVSTLFSLPSWQNLLYYTPIANNVKGSPTLLTNRGVPDVSAPFWNINITYNGSVVTTGGTSASCPIIASFLARFQQLTGVTRSSTDWHNFFYNSPYGSIQNFYDITTGQNNDAISDGYAGTSGWDAVTGLGAPTNSGIYQNIHKGFTFPKQNYGFRPSSGPTYPRKTTGAR